MTPERAKELMDALKERDERIEELEMELMCCGDARGLEGMEYGRRIEELEAEHGDMNVHCVKLEKENEHLRAALVGIKYAGTTHQAVAIAEDALAAVQETDDE